MADYKRRLLITPPMSPRVREQMTLTDFQMLAECVNLLAYRQAADMANDMRIDLDLIQINHDIRLDRHMETRWDGGLHRPIFDEITTLAVSRIVEHIDVAVCEFMRYRVDNRSTDGDKHVLILSITVMPCGSVIVSSDVTKRKD